MAFHIVHAGLTTNNTKKSKSKKTQTQSQIKAKADHEKYLKSMGVHPDQLSAKKTNTSAKKLTPWLTIDEATARVSNGFALSGAKTSIFDSEWQRTYEDDPAMAEREAEALRRAEALKARTAPAYSKGAYQLITPGEDVKTLGKKI